MHSEYDRISSDIRAKNTVYARYMYGPGQPYSNVFVLTWVKNVILQRHLHPTRSPPPPTPLQPHTIVIFISFYLFMLT